MHRGALPRLVAPVVLVAVLLTAVAAHQSLSEVSISRNVACRIGFGQFCPGPCPATDLRLDVNKNNPPLIVRRGQRLHLRTLANNHEGGFSRWTIVHVRDMMNHKKHRRNTFLWSCADTGRRYCSQRYKSRDCNYDISNVHYNHYVKIPTIYPDGVYVLGWVWLGGGGTWGFFGDYYDCSYIQIRGGPGPDWKHEPQFKPGPSHLANKGMCRATVNDVGICTREPCEGGGRYTQLFKPKPFENGKKPDPLYRDMFGKPYRRPKSSVAAKSLTIRRNWDPKKILHRARASSALSRKPYLSLKRSMGITITCETTDNVRSVTWYVNGYRTRIDRTKPFSIGGDWPEGYITKVVKYAKWMFFVDRQVTVVSAKAKGYNGDESWITMEISAR